jgi:hypothetical protein
MPTKVSNELQRILHRIKSNLIKKVHGGESLIEKLMKLVKNFSVLYEA